MLNLNIQFCGVECVLVLLCGVLTEDVEVGAVGVLAEGVDRHALIRAGIRLSDLRDHQGSFYRPINPAARCALCRAQNSTIVFPCELWEGRGLWATWDGNLTIDGPACCWAHWVLGK